MTQNRLQQWLEKIQLLHPQEIDMGLARVQQVADRLQLGRPAPTVITVTGTNGKGSHVATLDALFQSQGLRVGCYTSPHLVHYNERVCINGQPVSDQALVQAFDAIDAARGDISLTYFEFGTLAALFIFAQAGLDVAVLEVGMGGRLDAVNIIDADLAIVTHIDLDHQEWLGNTRELIAIEKAGVFRPGKTVVCAEHSPPQTLLAAAAALDCPVYLPDRDYYWTTPDQQQWSWQGCLPGGDTLQLTDLPMPTLAPGNVASALQAALLSGLIHDHSRIAGAMMQIRLPGRQQWITVPGTSARVMLDVAHNPHAAAALASRLKKECTTPINSQVQKTPAKVHMVLAMMADKDHAGFYRALENQVDFWYIAHFDSARCLPADDLASKWQRLAQQSGRNLLMQVFDNVRQGFEQACQQASEHDIIVVCGSFITVSDVMSVLESRV